MTTVAVGVGCETKRYEADLGRRVSQRGEAELIKKVQLAKLIELNE
jgi:hypothetical protein